MYVRLRDFHFFPTRRSSGLDQEIRIVLFLLRRPQHLGERARPRERHVLGPFPVGRSEEQPSELQSLTNLVCLLRLEKKKNIYIMTKVIAMKCYSSVQYYLTQ